MVLNKESASKDEERRMTHVTWAETDWLRGGEEGGEKGKKKL